MEGKNCLYDYKNKLIVYSFPFSLAALAILCYNKSKARPKPDPYGGTPMKYTTILCLLALLLALAFAGCSRAPQPHPQPSCKLLPRTPFLLPTHSRRNRRRRKNKTNRKRKTAARQKKTNLPMLLNPKQKSPPTLLPKASRRQPSRPQHQRRCSPTFPRNCRPVLLPN